ncbi:MAG: dockerin type I repeat-containing protein [Clostridiales bacterium]|nr:dockerin type I repeat-containing protein [Clostridiales bacterium]
MKKILSIIICIFMLCACMSVLAFAEYTPDISCLWIEDEGNSYAYLLTEITAGDLAGLHSYDGNEEKITITRDGKELASDDAVLTGDVWACPHGEHTVILLGDADGNGKISVADARLALRISAGLETADDLAAAAADMNGDGTVNAADSRTILRCAAGLDILEPPETLSCHTDECLSDLTKDLTA